MIASSWQYGLTFIAAWHPIIDLDASLFTHESQLYPVLTSWRYNWDTVFLRIHSLPYSFSWIDISDWSVTNELELRGNPLAVFWHGEAKIKTAIDRDLNCLWLIGRIISWSTLSWWFLLCFLVSCGSLLCSLSLSNFSLGFEPLNKTNDFWFWHKFILVDGWLCLVQEFQLGFLFHLLLEVSCAALLSESHERVFSCLFTEFVFALLFHSSLLDFLVVHDLFDVLIGS